MPTTEQNYSTIVFSPLEQFEVRNLLSLDAPILGDINLSMTNIGLYLTIGALIVLTLNILATGNLLCILGKCDRGDKSSNFGNTLKLMIPSNICKNICGWSNYSWMVISHKMTEREIGNRGSKSNNKFIWKRATSKWWLMWSNISHLRCTLMGFERNYQVKIPSNQLNKKQYSARPPRRLFGTTFNISPENPWFITGLMDAESSFQIRVRSLPNGGELIKKKLSLFLGVLEFFGLFWLYFSRHYTDLFIYFVIIPVLKLDPNNEIFYQWLSGFSEGEIQILSTLFYELLLSLDSAFLFIMPAVTYCNPEIQKAQILNENKGKSGVYRWTNKESGKSYVGSAVDLSKRLCLYYNNYHLTKVNMVINKALKKHKHSNFTLDILEYCERSDAISREQHFIDLLKPVYNILSTAGSLLGFKHSEKTKAIFSANRKGKNNMFGKSHSLETKALMSFA